MTLQSIKTRKGNREGQLTIEIYITRDSEEQKATFFASVLLIAKLLKGDASWQGASDELAAIRIYKDNEEEVHNGINESN